MQRETCVKTFGEIFPYRGMIELVKGNTPQAGFQLLAWDGTKTRIFQSGPVEIAHDPDWEGTVFEPPDVDHALLRAIRFPADAAPYASNLDLFLEVYTLILQYTDLPEELGRLLTYSVFASWFSDCTPIPICVSIMGPDCLQGWQLFRLLNCLCRRGLMLSDVNFSALCSLPTGLSPTLFLEQRKLSPQSEKFLYASNARDTFILWRGRPVNLCWAKVLRSEEPLSSLLFGASAIEIPVDPGCGSLPLFDPQTQQNIANRFQPKLLMYRLKNFDQIVHGIMDFPDFVPPVRELASCLAICVPDMFELRADMTRVLEERNRQVQSECEMDLNVIVLDAMLSFCHQENRQSVRVAEVALAVNTILEQAGETLELSPKAVGARLKSLGFYTKRIDGLSRGMLLTNATRRRIHKLSWDCGATGARDVEHCEYCKDSARLEKERRLPCDPLKSLRASLQSRGDQKQPLTQPNPVQGQADAQSEDFRSSLWVETEDDQKFVDQVKKENEL